MGWDGVGRTGVGRMGKSKDVAVEEFSARLRALKARDGRSYESLGRRLNVSASTLHRYCSGEAVPEGFAVIDRMTRLCGADEDERRTLEDLWTRADRSRRPIPEREQEAVPEPEPVPEPDPAPEPEPVPERAHRPRTRRRLLAAAAVAAAAVGLALVLVHIRPGLPTAPAPPPPFTWTADSQVWENGCGHTYLVDRAPDRTAPPPPPSDAAKWAGAHRAVHGEETLVRISVQGRSPSAAVLLQALHVRVVDRAAPLPWTAYRMDNGCGGAVTPRHFAVDLDRPRPAARSVDGYDASGEEGRTIPAVSFPYKVTAADPEVLLVTARTAACDCRWYLELVWSAEGRSGTVRIGDADGRPFRTSGIVGRPVLAYDTPGGGRWITVENSGQSG